MIITNRNGWYKIINKYQRNTFLVGTPTILKILAVFLEQFLQSNSKGRSNCFCRLLLNSLTFLFLKFNDLRTVCYYFSQNERFLLFCRYSLLSSSDLIGPISSVLEVMTGRANYFWVRLVLNCLSLIRLIKCKVGDGGQMDSFPCYSHGPRFLLFICMSQSLQKNVFLKKWLELYIDCTRMCFLINIFLSKPNNQISYPLLYSIAIIDQHAKNKAFLLILSSKNMRQKVVKLLNSYNIQAKYKNNIIKTIKKANRKSLLQKIVIIQINSQIRYPSCDKGYFSIYVTSIISLSKIFYQRDY